MANRVKCSESLQDRYLLTISQDSIFGLVVVCEVCAFVKMDLNFENENNISQDPNELLKETQELKLKRDMLAAENEELRSYLKSRQIESASTCEQLKFDIEQQIEQFENLDQGAEPSYLETLKSFRSEIEAIQNWNAKIRQKYFSRDALRNATLNAMDTCIANEKLIHPNSKTTSKKVKKSRGISNDHKTKIILK